MLEIEGAVKSGLEGKQRTLGFHTSAACADMLEIHLHKLGLLPDDHLLKHEWFVSKNKLKEKLPFDFKGKDELLELIRSVEIKRNNFCYGKKKTIGELESLVDDFNKVKQKFDELEVSFEGGEDEKE